MLIDPYCVNVKKTFGCFAVLLDDRNQLVPLKSDGSAVEPLEVHRRYTVVANAHGSSKLKWDDMRQQKGKHKQHKQHKPRHSSSSSSSNKKKKCSNGGGKHSTSMTDVLDLGVDKMTENGCDELTMTALISKNASQPTNFAIIDFGVSTENLLMPTVDDMLSMNMGMDMNVSMNMNMNMNINMNTRTEFVM